jgi:hypothetical protein
LLRTNDSVGLVANFAISLPFAVLWAIAATGLLIRHHYKRRAFLERPFVLFLRRFSTFSDRAVVAVILRQAAYNVPVVFLTPTLSRPGDWDLFLCFVASSCCIRGRAHLSLFARRMTLGRKRQTS